MDEGKIDNRDEGSCVKGRRRRSLKYGKVEGTEDEGKCTWERVECTGGS